MFGHAVNGQAVALSRITSGSLLLQSYRTNYAATL